MQPGEINEDWEKANVFMNVKMEGPGNYGLVIITSVPGNLTKQLILETILKLMSDKVVGSNQTGFIKGKLYLIHLIAF